MYRDAALFLATFALLGSMKCGTSKIQSPIDLSHCFDENSVYLPGVTPFMYTSRVVEYRDESWFASNEFCTGAQGGTHLDAPFHYYKNGWKVAEIPLSRLIAQGIVMNVTGEAAKWGSSTLLRPQQLEKWKTLHGPLPNHCILLIRFGWSKYYGDRDEYLGINETGLYFPGVSPSAARWIADSGCIVGVGIDTAGVDGGQSAIYEVHRIFAEKQIYVMENVNISSSLPARGFTLAVMPLKLKSGSGAPLRIIAVPDTKLRREFRKYLRAKSNVPWYGDKVILCCTFMLVGMYLVNVLINRKP